MGCWLLWALAAPCRPVLAAVWVQHADFVVRGIDLSVVATCGAACCGAFVAGAGRRWQVCHCAIDVFHRVGVCRGGRRD